MALMFKMGKIMPWLELPDRAKFDGFDKAIVAFAMLRAALLVTTPTDLQHQVRHLQIQTG